MMPALTITEAGGRIRLDLAGIARGEGSSLQEAADMLVRRARELALAVQSGRWRAAREFCPDFETMNFLYELGEIAAAGGDLRARLFE